MIAAGRRHRPPAAVVVASAVALLTAACGGSGPPVAGGSTGSPATVAYSACMRSHGVPGFPDPDSGGRLPKADAHHLGVSDTQLQAAQRSCRHLLPTSTASLTQCLMTGDCPAAVVQPALTEGRTFARCMRGHGVPSWPDPTIDAMGRPSFQVTAAGISIASTRSPRILATIGRCQSQPGAVLLRQE
jgi:hypothetical protein